MSCARRYTTLIDLISDLGARSLLMAAFVVLALAPLASAQPTATWTGLTDTNWATTTNWVGNNPPGGAFVNVLFDSTSQLNLTTVNNIPSLILNTIGIGPGVAGGVGQP